MTFLDTAGDLKRAQARALKLFVIVTLVVGGSASLFTEPNIASWYAHLVRPAIAPPNWVFAPVWTTLYVVMATAAWRVWKTAGLRSPALVAWMVQLALNFAWSFIFFWLHQMFAALVEIAVLDLAVLVTLVLSWRRDRWAGLLLVPYLGWTLFATLLTHEFWRLNA